MKTYFFIFTIILLSSCVKQQQLIEYPKSIIDNRMELVYDKVRWFFYLNYFDYDECEIWLPENLKKKIKNKKIVESYLKLLSLQINSDTIEISIGIYLNDSLRCFLASKNNISTNILENVCVNKKTGRIISFREESLITRGGSFFNPNFLKAREEKMIAFLKQNRYKLDIDPWLWQEAKKRRGL